MQGVYGEVWDYMKPCSECPICQAQERTLDPEDDIVQAHWEKHKRLGPRIAWIDGMPHDRGGNECGCNRDCRRCGALLHYQAVWGGYVEVCEQCPEDAHCWSPA